MSRPDDPRDPNGPRDPHDSPDPERPDGVSDASDEAAEASSAAGREPANEIEAFRIQELLMLRATEGLSAAQAAELSSLGAEDDESFELAAAAIHLTTLPREDMPYDVAQRILQAAGARLPRPGQSPAQSPGTGQPPPAARVPTTVIFSTGHPYPPKRSPSPLDSTSPSAPLPLPPARPRAPRLAWAAAGLGLAVAAAAILWAQQQKPEVVVQRVVERVEVPAPPPTVPTPAAARAQLVASAADVQTLAWTATADPSAVGAGGDVVWSASLQEGYLRFTNLAPNDPKLLQYQLWIFDKARDERYPVDGGVFDVGPGGEVIVKIAPKLHVDEPVLFAVTIEPPGGVVVSKRERIVVTAAPEKAG